MKFFVKAIITGFGLSLGAALYKKLAKRFGFDDKDDAPKEEEADKVTTRDGATDPSLSHAESSLS
jgi:hypothetical protein